MKPEPNVLTEDEFQDTYLPRTKESGDLFEYEDVKNEPLNTVWSIVEGDGPWNHWYAITGFHIVNMLGYVLTETPWTDESTTAYWFFDDRTAYTAVLDDGEEVDEIGETQDDALERIENTYDQKVVSIKLHEQEVA